MTESEGWYKFEDIACILIRYKIRAVDFIFL